MSEFKAGDVAVLRSGGPIMTITSRDDKVAECAWFAPLSNSGLHFSAVNKSTFPLVCLVNSKLGIGVAK